MLFISKENASSKIEIKKSIFISYLFNVNNKEEIKKTIKDYKIKFKNSTHLVYGFRIGEEKSFLQGMNDGREPRLTAGKATLDAIIANNLTDTLIITIRYFGGIFLGKGGLIRAYFNTAKQVISKAQLTEKQELETLTLDLKYSQYQNLIKNKKKFNFKIINSIFLKSIQVKIEFNKKNKNKIEDFFKKRLNIDNIYI